MKGPPAPPLPPATSPPPSPPGRQGGGRRRAEVARAMAILIALRVVYAYNWFDIGPGLPQVGTDLSVSVSYWGIVLAAFFAGASCLQVPAGLLARRYGNRLVALAGALLLGAGAVASAAAPDFLALVLLRFAAGAGAGLFFSPAIALVSDLYPRGSRGVPVGIFSSAFAAGAGLGTFVPALIIPALGWRETLVLGGALMLGLTLAGQLLVPRWAGSRPGTEETAGARLPRALRSPSVWGIGLAFVGLEGASLSTSQFFVPYAESLGWGAALAGAVGALFVFPSLFGGPVGGRLIERFTHRRAQLAVFTGVPALFLILIPRLGVVEVAVIATSFSFCFGMVYAMMYVIPPYLPNLTEKDLSLAIGLLNGVQLAGGTVVAVVVGWVHAEYGYPALWTTLGTLTVLPLLFLLLIPASVSQLKPRAAPGAPS